MCFDVCEHAVASVIIGGGKKLRNSHISLQVTEGTESNQKTWGGNLGDSDSCLFNASCEISQRLKCIRESIMQGKWTKGLKDKSG